MHNDNRVKDINDLKLLQRIIDKTPDPDHPIWECLYQSRDNSLRLQGALFLKIPEEWKLKLQD